MGGTGPWALAISRELATPGWVGEIHLSSNAPARAAPFVLYLPLKYSGPDGGAREPPLFTALPPPCRCWQGRDPRKRIIEQAAG